MPELTIMYGDKQIRPVVAMGETLFSLSKPDTLEPEITSAGVKQIIIKTEGRLDYIMDTGDSWSKEEKLLFASSDEAMAHWVKKMEATIRKKAESMAETG